MLQKISRNKNCFYINIKLLFVIQIDVYRLLLLDIFTKITFYQTKISFTKVVDFNNNHNLTFYLTSTQSRCQ